MTLKDQDIREPLFDYLEETYGKVRIFEEKQIGRSRADVMMVTENALFGIEIKSDADTYARLERQVKDYNRFYDYCIVAVGSTHAHGVQTRVPDWWGIITIEPIIAEDGNVAVDFYLLRSPMENPKREKNVKLRNQLSFLWRQELAHIQKAYGFPKYAGKSKRFIADYLIEHLSEEELKRQISEELFERDYSEM